jgi:hypothetical protein
LVGLLIPPDSSFTCSTPRAAQKLKELLVRHLPEIPDEVRKIAGDIESRLSAAAKN